MSRLHVFSMAEPFIERVADRLAAEAGAREGDLRRCAVVFGGRRPRLFLQRALARRLKGPYLAPRFFTVDEFAADLLSGRETFGTLTDLDASHLIYEMARQVAPRIVRGRPRFSDFFPWAREILRFIEQLDLQAVPLTPLAGIQRQADIGYDVPENVNELLKNIVGLREAFHAELLKRRRYVRGFMYYRLSALIEDVPLEAFDTAYLCHFFYLHKTEERVFRRLYEIGKAHLLFQGSGRDWPVLEDLGRRLNVAIESPAPAAPAPRVRVHAGFDLHSQVGQVRDTLAGVTDPQKTVVVLPDTGALVPLLCDIAERVTDVNVSMGYPVTRTSLYALLTAVFEAQATRRGGSYYAKDYLRVLHHPLVKNLDTAGDPAATRILLHKVEEGLSGVLPTDLSGSLFIGLGEVAGCRDIFDAARVLLEGDTPPASVALKTALATLHRIFFEVWQEVKDLESFGRALEELLTCLLHHGAPEKYPLNLKLMERLFGICEELRLAACSREPFAAEELFKIFKGRLEHEAVAFSGSPLKGLQILGILETRGLAFENVLILDVNESVLPRLKISEPLIPRDVMISLGLDRLEKEEEIQRYQFACLLASAKNVDLFYQERDDRAPSRFLEGLIWGQELRAGRLGVVPVARGSWRIGTESAHARIDKAPEHLAHLERLAYSASSLDTYIGCPLRFYYQYVLGLREREELLDEAEGADIGNFVHELLEEAFRPFLGRAPRPDAAFRSGFFEKFDALFERKLARRMRADAFLVKEVLRVRMEEFLNREEGRPVAAVEAVERPFETRLDFFGTSFSFKGKIDRIDRLADGSLLVIDYKTGATDVTPRRGAWAARPLTRAGIKSGMRSLQVPLYLSLMEQEADAGMLDAALYYLRYADQEGGFKRFFGEDVPAEERRAILDGCKRVTAFILNEIRDPGVPFEPDRSDPKRCSYCPFFYLCR
ncbi:MAG: PD-(D/E)XK nuclease family protein [Deltaproteobacteria bacterium]